MTETPSHWDRDIIFRKTKAGHWNDYSIQWPTDYYNFGLESSVCSNIQVTQLFCLQQNSLLIWDTWSANINWKTFVVVFSVTSFSPSGFLCPFGYLNVSVCSEYDLWYKQLFFSFALEIFVSERQWKSVWQLLPCKLSVLKRTFVY